MKQILFLALCIALAANNNAFSQQKYDHWSLNLKAGIDRGEFSGGKIAGGNYAFTGGAELEYTINPLWGMLLDYGYVAYKNDDASGAANEFSFIGSINGMNLLWKYRAGNWQRLNAYARLGAGFSFYDSQNTGTTLVIPFSALLEYNFSKRVAAGIVGERRWHTSNTMGYNYVIQERPVIWSIMASFRFKFGGTKKQHIRNTSLTAYESAYTNNNNRYDDAPIRQSINNNDAAIKQLQDQISKANNEVSKLNNDLNKAKQEIEECCVEKELSHPNSFIPIKENVTLVEKNIEFEFNSSSLTNSSYPALNALAEKLKKQADIKIQVIGHTDNSGDEQLNKGLSFDRAKAVAEYLIGKGVEANRISINGMGFSKPIATNDTMEGRQQNRRVEFIFTR